MTTKDSNPPSRVKQLDLLSKAIHIARERMVREHLIARGIEDRRVLKAMAKIPRHLFVESALADRAYDDEPLPIGERQTISQPYTVALMTEALELKGGEKVLEVGTGSAYQTSVLAELCLNVFSVEKFCSLAERARVILDELSYYNVALHVGDGTLGWPEHAPYDAIIVTAGSPQVPRPLLKQLSLRGKMVVPIGTEQGQTLKRFRRTIAGVKEEGLGDCRFVKLTGRYGWPR